LPDRGHGRPPRTRAAAAHEQATRPDPGARHDRRPGHPADRTLRGTDRPDHPLIRPARKDEKQPRPFPNWLRQRVEAVIWTLKSQLGLERHGGRISAGLWACIIQRLLALNACIWPNWQIGAPVKRSLIAYDHV
jgi:hypothetical protein